MYQLEQNSTAFQLSKATVDLLCHRTCNYKIALVKKRACTGLLDALGNPSLVQPQLMNGCVSEDVTYNRRCLLIWRDRAIARESSKSWGFNVSKIQKFPVLRYLKLRAACNNRRARCVHSSRVDCSGGYRAGAARSAWSPR